MFRHILVPLDGSLVSEAALPYAQALAARTGAQLTLIRAAHGGSLTHPGASPLRAIGDADYYLTDVADRLALDGLRVDTGVPYGSPAEWIVEEIGLRGIDLVVMATHDRTGPQRWLRGSVAEAVVSQSPVPVLLIRAADGIRPAERFRQARPVLVVPLDGSEFAEAAVPVATDLAKVIEARLVLVAAVPAPGQLTAAEMGFAAYIREDRERLVAETRSYLEDVAQRIPAPGVKLECVVRFGEAATEIARVAQESAAAAVVMATHGRIGLARTIMGSVAGGVLHQSTSPVLLVSPPRLRTAEEPEPSMATAGAVPA
jgi:nucleotide-binding universal stress UspA family protein